MFSEFLDVFQFFQHLPSINTVTLDGVQEYWFKPEAIRSSRVDHEGYTYAACTDIYQLSRYGFIQF